MTTADYLNQLEQDRQDLVDNLETKGITGLSGDETFTELVPEVLNIPSGGGGVLPTNLRHIQVGDNLYNKKIYFTFPSDIYSQIKTYHQSFGDSGITYRGFISTFAITNPFAFDSSSLNNNLVISTYDTTGYNDWGSVEYYYASRGYGDIYSHRSTKVSYLGIDFSNMTNGNVNKDIAFIDTNNPAYNYVWIEDVN